MKVTGWPQATIVRGALVMQDDTITGPASGRLVQFR
jgi:dihydroorotase